MSSALCITSPLCIRSERHRSRTKPLPSLWKVDMFFQMTTGFVLPGSRAHDLICPRSALGRTPFSRHWPITSGQVKPRCFWILKRVWGPRAVYEHNKLIITMILLWVYYKISLILKRIWGSREVNEHNKLIFTTIILWINYKNIINLIIIIIT